MVLHRAALIFLPFLGPPAVSPGSSLPSSAPKSKPLAMGPLKQARSRAMLLLMDIYTRSVDRPGAPALSFLAHQDVMGHLNWITDCHITLCKKHNIYFFLFGDPL